MTLDLNRAPCINGFNIPQYYCINGIYVGAVPRSGSTSLWNLNKELNGQTLDHVPQTATCIVRDPIKRLASAWLLLPIEARRFTNEEGNSYREIMRPPIEEVIDAILGDYAEQYFTDKIGNSNHAYAWMRQSSLYDSVKFPEWIRLEGIESFHRLTLPVHNKSTEEKPAITHRLDELKDYYREDTELWEKAPTKI